MAQWRLGQTRETWQAVERKESAHRLRGMTDRKLHLRLEGARRTVAAYKSHPPLPGTRDYVVERLRESLVTARAYLAEMEAEATRRAAQPR